MEKTILPDRLRESLEKKIYDLLMESDNMDMGEMGNCRESAEALVREWAEENNIEFTD